MCLNIFAREYWYALKPNIFQSQRSVECKHVFWMNVKFQTCSTKLECMNLVSNTQKHNIFYQKIRDIRYNFVIGGDGCVYEGRGWTTAPLLPKQFDELSKESLLIGFLGFYTIDVLPEQMKEAANRLMKNGVMGNFISENYEFHDILKDLKKTDGQGNDPQQTS
ncbi:peptidoglycan recognition protein 1-like [Macrosteles quadrilineatus]|uniref:peptidoglycan recognition protein 1-like n=1 Tax=Macrosteles quadrilineatus TaxID=74068 RepID=UPI0023E0FD32|nr:peptidoglycan recognition protein 1-like [Macrosteles quadrilineatus]